MPSLLRHRLSAMMFLQYAVLGTTLPVLSLYLKDYLGFSGRQTGIVLAMSALAAVCAPLTTAFVADKLMSAERLLAGCHLFGAVLMLLLSRQCSFWPVLSVYLLYMIAMRPTLALTNAVAFHHLPGERSRFAGVRVWGTVGWIAVGWAFSYLWLRGHNGAGRLPDALTLSAGLSLAMCAYCLTLPRADAKARHRTSLLPTEALRVLRKPDMLILLLVNFMTFVVFQYYYVGAAPFLTRTGFTEGQVLPAMTLGQVTEVMMMSALAAVMARVRIKTILLVGAGAEIVRFLLFALGGSMATSLVAISCHGFSIAFMMIASTIYIDQRCSPAARSGAHQLFTVVTIGLAAMVGSILSGFMMDLCARGDGSVDYRLFWLAPFGIAVTAGISLVLLFPSRPVERSLR